MMLSVSSGFSAWTQCPASRIVAEGEEREGKGRERKERKGRRRRGRKVSTASLRVKGGKENVRKKKGKEGKEMEEER
jgi:hypothetical protein